MKKMNNENIPNNKNNQQEQQIVSKSFATLIKQETPSQIWDTLLLSYFPYTTPHILIESLTNLIVDHICSKFHIFANPLLKKKDQIDKINNFLIQWMKDVNFNTVFEEITRQRSQNGNAFVVINQAHDYIQKRDITTISVVGMQSLPRISSYLNKPQEGKCLITYGNEGNFTFQEWDLNNAKTYKINEKNSKKSTIEIIKNDYHGLGIIPIKEFKNREYYFPQAGFGWNYYPDWMPGATILPEYTMLKFSKLKETVINRSKLLGRIDPSYIDKMRKSNGELSYALDTVYVQSALNVHGESDNNLTFALGNQENLLHIDTSIENITKQFFKVCINLDINQQEQTYKNKQNDTNSRNHFHTYIYRNCERYKLYLYPFFRDILYINKLINADDKIEEFIEITFDDNLNKLNESEALNILITKAKLGMVDLNKVVAVENNTSIEEAKRMIQQNYDNNKKFLDTLNDYNITDNNAIENSSRGTTKKLGKSK